MRRRLVEGMCLKRVSSIPHPQERSNSTVYISLEISIVIFDMIRGAEERVW
jgi:hypothetical protein